jgi:hypothetical protein
LNPRAGYLVLAAAAIVASPAAAQDTVLRRPSSVMLRPLASLLLPGTGQLLGRQDRGAVYLAAEVYLLSHYLQLHREAQREADRFQALAYDIARRSFQPARRDTLFEYYEQMERFVESGRYDVDPGTGFAPETDPRTYNGSVWLLARRTYWENPDVPPDPSSQQYADARLFYWQHAVGPGYQWSWRDHSLEHQVYREAIRRSDNAFRRAQNQVGLLLANHIVSAVDALISTRLTSAVGRSAEMRTTLGPSGVHQIQFLVAF